MNPGLTPPPGDEAPDPLLAALRQRLGAYGAAPPPAAWAAIRQRLAPPQPWWRRPRRLLPLLALLLAALRVGPLGEPQPGPRATAARRAARPSAAANAPGRSPRPAADHSPALAQVTASNTKGLSRATRAARKSASSALALPAPTGKPAAASPAELPLARVRPTGAVAAAARQPRRAAALAGATASLRRHGLGASLKQTAVQPTLNNSLPIALQRRNATQLAGRLQEQRAKQPFQWLAAAAPASATRRRVQKKYSLEAPAAVPPALAGNRPQGASRPQKPLARAAGLRPVVADSSLPAADAPLLPASLVGLAGQSTALNLLALKQPSLLLPEPARPGIVAARPDSSFLPSPVRRWALLLVAGPTLSYRTLGPAPTLAAGHPDFARLERPALGLGAQVQVRRALSGRWALALGLGYQEYATRLALTRKDTAFSVRQRDAYRLLTLPVQFTYALGAPRKRLATGLLLGAEPGWYVSGRSTEGSSCGCEQQVYSSAFQSPYRSWSLALSLGLDLRYHVGGPTSRWRWLVQPTARYVATPFVRGEAVGFTRRQPFSLGLLTGFSWDVR